MSTRSAQIAGTANVPVRLDFVADADYRDGCSALVRVTTADWYLGGADVTTSNGFLVHADEVWDNARLTPGDPTYGVCASACTYYALLQGV